MANVKKKLDSSVFSFKDLTNSLREINEDAYILSDSPYTKVGNFIDVGHYLLNAQISGSIFGGIPEGRITILSGESGSGKSYLCLNASHAAQRQGYNIIWFDSENALDVDTTDRFKIKPNTFTHIPVGAVSEVTNYLANLSKTLLEKQRAGSEIPKILIILDSIGNLSTDKELKDSVSGSDKSDMTRAKELKKLFRVITKDLGLLKIPMLATNHVYDNVGSFIPQKIMSGGSGPIFSSSTIIQLSKAQLKEDATGPVTGIIVTSKMKKSRFTKAGIDIKFYISFYHGMNPYLGLEQFLDWDKCGIGPGKIEKGVYIPEETEKDKVSKYYAVKSLGKHIKTKELYTSKIFTKEVLDSLEPILRDKFEFKESSDYELEIQEMVGHEEDDE